MSSRIVRKEALEAGFRSGLEQDIAAQLDALGVDYGYENMKIKYTPKERTYTPDFPLPNFIIEAKGRFTAADRAKHLLIKKQHPHLDIRFVFTNPNQRLSKRSKTTYAQWCEKHGFLYAKKEVPEEWLKS